MTDGNTHAIAQHLDEREDWDALQEAWAELEDAESDNILLIARIEELEAELEEQVEWVKSLAYDLISAEGREALLKEKLENALEALERIGKGEFAGQSLMSFPPQDAAAHYARVKLGLIKRTKGEIE